MSKEYRVFNRIIREKLGVGEFEFPLVAPEGWVPLSFSIYQVSSTNNPERPLEVLIYYSVLCVREVS